MLYVKDVFVYHSNIRVTDEKQKHLHELMNIHITSSAVGELTDASLTTPSCCVLVLWHLTEELELLFPAFFFSFCQIVCCISMETWLGVSHASLTPDPHCVFGLLSFSLSISASLSHTL